LFKDGRLQRPAAEVADHKGQAAEGRRSEPARCQFRSVLMTKNPRKIEIVQQGDERFILKVFADGREEREPIAKLPRKKRYPPRPYWQWDLSKIRKKDF
jgi:hypothetical protein